MHVTVTSQRRRLLGTLVLFNMVKPSARPCNTLVVGMEHRCIAVLCAAHDAVCRFAQSTAHKECMYLMSISHRLWGLAHEPPIQVTFGENINFNLAQNFQTVLLTQNMTEIFGSNPAFQVLSSSKLQMG